MLVTLDEIGREGQIHQIPVVAQADHGDGVLVGGEGE